MRIAPRDQDVGGRVRLDHAMGKKTSLPSKQHDVPYGDARDFDGTNEEDVGRSNGRTHARPRYSDVTFTESPKQGGNQLGGHLSDCGGSSGRMHGRRHEFFLLALHCPLTGFVFPHASAIVSKTVSWTNAGFWYAFFAPAPGGGAGVGSVGFGGVTLIPP